MSTVLPLLLEPLLPELALLLLLLLLLPQATIPMTEPTSRQPVTALPRVRILLLWNVLPGPQRPTKKRSVVWAPDCSNCSSRGPNLTATRCRSGGDLLPEPQTAANNAINAVAPKRCVAVGLDAVSTQHAAPRLRRKDRRSHLRTLRGSGAVVSGARDR